MIDLQDELRRALLGVRAEFHTFIRDAVRDELAAMREAPDPAELIDVREVARLLGRTEAAIRRASERGTLPLRAVRVGRTLRFNHGEVLALAQGRGRR